MVEESYPVDTVVSLSGMERAGYLNGSTGVVVGYINKKGRIPVKIVDPPSAASRHPHTVAVLPLKLNILQYPEEVISRIVMMAIDSMESALDQDMYPPEGIERIFGIKMSPSSGSSLPDMPIGGLMYCCWASLWNAYIEYRIPSLDELEIVGEYVKTAGLALKKEIKDAILSGELHEWFRDSVMMYAIGVDNVYSQSSYFMELIRRNFDGIVYDTELHDRYNTKKYARFVRLAKARVPVSPTDPPAYEPPAPVDEFNVVEIKQREGNGLRSAMINHVFKSKVEGMAFIASKLDCELIPIISENAAECGWEMKVYCSSTLNNFRSPVFGGSGNFSINGAGVYLTSSISTGLSPYLKMQGDVFVIGRKVGGRKDEQVTHGIIWGLLNLIWDSMDWYADGDIPAAIAYVERMANRYKAKTWTPCGGSGEMPIYSTDPSMGTCVRH